MKSSGPFSHIRSAVRCEVGLKRKNNEDSHGEFPDCGIWCVADGMGGGDDGEVASAAVIQEVAAWCKCCTMNANKAYAGADMAKGVSEAVNRASQWIFDRANKKSLKGCGSTFVGVVLDAGRPNMAMALHAGDSRLYRMRGKNLKQITKDHSAAELMGEKDESQLNPMFRGMILRAVGIHPVVEVELTLFDLREGDTILICSDGLSKMVPDRKIATLIRESEEDIKGAAAKLIDATYAAGAVDNVTFQLLRVGHLPLPLPTQSLPTDVKAQDTAGLGGEEATTVETFVGSSSQIEETSTQAGDKNTNTTMVFDVVEDNESEKNVRHDWLRFCHQNKLWFVVAGVLGLIALFGWYVVDMMHTYTLDKQTTAVNSVPIPMVSMDTEVNEQEIDKPIVVKETEQATIEEVLSVVEEEKPLEKQVDYSADEREREELRELLKSKRQSVRQDELRVLHNDVALNDALGRLIQSCRGAAFDELIARVETANGTQYSNRLRMLGQQLAAMRIDDENVSLAASDLVAEIQKVVAIQKEGTGEFKSFAGILGLDTTTAKAFLACAEIILAHAADNLKKDNDKQ